MKKNLLATALLLSSYAQATVTIDVMVVYDSAAVQYLNQKHLNQVLFAHDVVNKLKVPMNNSGVDVNFRLAHTMSINYHNVAGNNGTNMGSDLNYIAKNQQVKARREQYLADIVIFLININRPMHGGWVAGIAYMPCSYQNGQIAEDCSREHAYSVVSIQDTNDSATASHEVGHNLGAAHSRQQAGAKALPAFVPYGYGAYFTGNDGIKYHTVMSYMYQGSVEAPYFSTPCKTHQGSAVGVANYTDNARVLKQTIGMVANYYGPSQNYSVNLNCDTTPNNPTPTDPIIFKDNFEQ